MHVRSLFTTQVMHILLVRGPPELQLPYKLLGLTVKAYCAWVDHLVAGSSSALPPTGASAGDAYSSGESAAVALFATPAMFVAAEGAVWAQVRSCLDTYAQRLSTAAGGVASGVAEEYNWLVGNGPKLLAAYRAAHGTV